MENGIATINKEKIKVKKPSLYKVIMHNDDFTNTSNKIMMDVHKRGIGIVGVYPYDIAATKVAIALGMAKEEGFPFNITIEEE